MAIAWARPATWPLRTQLIAAVVVLFSVVTLATGAATVALSRQYLLNQLDGALLAAHQRIVGPQQNGGRIGPRRDDRGGLPPAADGGGLHVEFVSDDVDAAPAIDSRTGELENYAVTRRGANARLTTGQLHKLSSTPLSMRPETIDLGGDLGEYRVVESTRRNGLVVVTGLRENGVNQFLERILTFVVAGFTAGLVIVIVSGTYVVGRALKPLNRVAATAQRVGNMRLESGEIAGFERVPADDTNPDTEVGQVGLALNHMIDNVEGALQARQDSETRVRQFVADASHELRTPLASIRGYAEISQRDPEAIPDQVRHSLTRVESEAVRMTSLVEDLLLLARLDEGRPLDRTEVDLSMLVVDAVSDAHAASPDHVWRLDLPDEPISVIGDQTRLHQVLANLLANARVHTPVGTPVTTSLRRAGDGVVLSVTDEGPGIPDAVRSTVFERFTRGEDSRVRNGGSTGLGLSIVAAVTQAHRGRVAVDSTPGRTTFSVTLPTPPTAT